MAKFAVEGIGRLEGELRRLGSAAALRAVARSGAEAAVGQVGLAFRTEGAHYGEKWAPRKESTVKAAGAASAGARAAREKAAEFRRKAEEQDYATVWLEGKARAKAAKAAEKAAKKAKEWRGKARAAAAKAAAKKAAKPLLEDTGTLRDSFFAEDRGAAGFAVATPVRYAKYHESGTSKMDARPVMPFDAAGKPRSGAVERAVLRAMEDRLREIAGLR